MMSEEKGFWDVEKEHLEKHTIRSSDWGVREEMDRIYTTEYLMRDIYIDKLKGQYSGPFDIRELRLFIKDWAKNNHYLVEELANKHIVKPEGKKITLEYNFQKKISDYTFLLINLSFECEDVVDVRAIMGARDITMSKGDIEMVMNGFVLYDHNSRWESKAFFALFRTIVDKFIYKLDRGKPESQLVSEGNDLMGKLKAYFNSIRFRYERIIEPKEEEEKKEAKPEEKADKSSVVTKPPKFQIIEKKEEGKA